MKRGRPKGRSKDSRSYGPLGDLLRQARLERQLGLADIARACQCSVQFISNIEHGRAPLPWDKVPALAQALGLAVDRIQAANLSVRSDFQTFVHGVRSTGVTRRRSATTTPRPAATSEILAAALTARDKSLQALIVRYQAADVASRKKFLKAAMAWLAPRG